jgi:uncharacterized OB-fold protein
MKGRMGTVYTETVVYAAQAAFAEEAPYQVAIVKFEDGSRTTGRILEERVTIGDTVVETDPLHNAPAFRKV